MPAAGDHLAVSAKPANEPAAALASWGTSTRAAGELKASAVAAARAIMAENLKLSVQCLLAHRDQIRHAEPELALRFAQLHAITSIEAIAVEPVSLWHSALAEPDDVLAHVEGLNGDKFYQIF